MQMNIKRGTRSAVNALQIRGSEDFGVGCHTAFSKPYFYDSAYQYVKRDHAIPIDENGIGMVANQIKTDRKTTNPKHLQSFNKLRNLLA